MEQPRYRPDAERLGAEKRQGPWHPGDAGSGQRDGEEDRPEEQPGRIEELGGEIQRRDEAGRDGEDEKAAGIEQGGALAAGEQREPDARKEDRGEPGREE